MRLLPAVLILILGAVTTNTHYIDDVSEEQQSIQTIEHKLVNTRKTLLSKLDGCTIWRDGIEVEKRDTLERLLVRGQFEKFRDFAIRVARDSFPDDEDCLKSAKFLIKKYSRILQLKKRYLGSDEAVHIEEFLSPRQLNDLHDVYTKTGRREEIVSALHRFFEGLSEERKDALVQEFFAYKSDLRRRPRDVAVHIDESTEDVRVVEPEELDPLWLKWMTPRHKVIISRMKSSGADKWEKMNMIAVQFYHQRKEIRKKYQIDLQNYCTRNLKNILGESSMEALKVMYFDNDPVDQIETKFNVLVSDLQNEKDRLLADHYGSFCRKIFRLVQFEPTDLTAWLTTRQKFQLGEMIQDPEVGDVQVYKKVFEFFEAAEGEQKEEASDTIDTGCRHFIAHMFGDDTAEELEDLRLQGNVSSQQLAARLALHAKEISSTKLRARAEQSLPICKRIYLGYGGSCDCNGHSHQCDQHIHVCRNCTDNTEGVQCHKCVDGFTGDATSPEGCSPVEIDDVEEESAPCQCNMHSESCTAEGKCIDCQHNTEGDGCDRCQSGFYGEATKGGSDACTACPCPGNGDCFINDDGLVQCSKCPLGTKGIMCEERDNAKRGGSRESDSSEEKKEDEAAEALFLF